MKRATIARAAGALLFAACTAAPPLPAPDRTHPASPAADEAPEPAPGSTLVMPVRTPPAPTAPKRGH